MTYSRHSELVRERADSRCEYCRIPLEGFSAATWFVVEHIWPRVLFEEGDPARDDPLNLAWSCPLCNAHKANKTQATDPVDGTLIPLFNPRVLLWADHFLGLPSGHIEGLTVGVQR